SLPHRRVEGRPAVPGNRRLEGAADHADSGRHAAAPGNEGVTPGAHGTLPARGLTLGIDPDLVLVHHRAEVAADGDRLAQGPLLRHLRRLEGDDEERSLAVEPGAG